jgi:hypothetical protein
MDTGMHVGQTVLLHNTILKNKEDRFFAGISGELVSLIFHNEF